MTKLDRPLDGDLVARQSFLAGIPFADLQRLRAVVKRTHMKFYEAHRITDHECDRIIEAIGPKVAEQMIARAVDGGAAQAKSVHIMPRRLPKLILP